MPIIDALNVFQGQSILMDSVEQLAISVKLGIKTTETAPNVIKVISCLETNALLIKIHIPEPHHHRIFQ
jgi:hypothetical protein